MDLLGIIEEKSIIESDVYEEDSVQYWEGNNKRIFSDYSDCPICHGTFYDKNKKVNCKCKRTNLLRKSAAKSNIDEDMLLNRKLCYYMDSLDDVNIQFHKNAFVIKNKKYISKKYDSIMDTDRFINCMKKYYRNFDEYRGYGIIFTGMPGIGKTSMATILAKNIFFKNPTRVSKGKKPYDIFMMTAPNILECIKKSWSKEATREDYNVIERLYTCDLLILDDIGSEYSKNDEWLNSLFLNILKNRDNNFVSTLITTNLTLEELSEKYEDGASRMLSLLCGRYNVFEFAPKFDGDNRLEEEFSLEDEDEWQL